MRSPYERSLFFLKLINIIDLLKIPIDRRSFADLLETIKAPLSMRRLFFVTERFEEISSLTRQICKDSKWRELAYSLEPKIETCRLFNLSRDRIQDNLSENMVEHFTKTASSQRNNSLSLLGKSSLYATLGHFSMSAKTNKHYTQLQAHALISDMILRAANKKNLTIKEHKSLLKQALLDVRSLAKTENQHQLILLPDKPCSPEQYLKAIESLHESHRIRDHFEKLLQEAIELHNQDLHEKNPEFLAQEEEESQIPAAFRGLPAEALDLTDKPFDFYKLPRFSVENVDPGYDILISLRLIPEQPDEPTPNLTHASKQMARDNQLFHFAWSELSFSDINILLQEISSGSAKLEDEVIANALLHLMIWVGFDGTRISEIRLDNADSEQEDIYFSDTGILRINSNGPHLKKTDSISPRYALRKQNFIDLQLPECAKQAVARALPLLTNRVNTTFCSLPPKKITAICNNRILAIRKDEKASRLTLSRITNFHFRALSRMPKCDIATASLTLDKKEFLARTKIHYASFDSAFLSDRFRESCCQLLQNIESESKFIPADPFKQTRHVGTPFRLQKQTILNTVNRIQADINSTRGSISTAQELISFHNLFSTYTALLICYATGHRRAKTPYIHQGEWDPKLQLACIRDKDTTDFHHSRLVWMPECCIQQIQNYQQHILQIYLSLGLLPPDSISHTPDGFPDFFFIKKGKADLGFSIFTEQLARFDYKFDGHPQRHFLKSELQENACDPDITEFFLGHWFIGQEPWVKTSSLHPYDFRQELDRHIPDLLRQLDFKPLTGIPSAEIHLDIQFSKGSKKNPLRAGKTEKAVLHQRPGDIWYEILPPGRQKNQKSLDQFRREETWVLHHLDRQIPALFQGHDVPPISEHDFSAFLNKLTPSGLHPDRKYRRIAFLNKGLQYGKKHYGWVTPVLQDPKVISKVKNRVRPSAMRKLTIFRELEKAFLEDLENALPATQKKRIGQIIFSGILYGGLLNEQWIKCVPSALKDGIFQQRGWMWLDLYRGKKESAQEFSREKFYRQSNAEAYRRWLPDPLTQTLIHRWLEEASEDREDMHISANKAVKAYISHLGVGQQLTSKTLLKLLLVARAYLTLTVPPFLCAFAENDLPSSSLPDQIWIRSLTGRKIPIPYGRRSLRNHKITPISNYSTLKQLELFKSFKKIFKQRNIPALKKAKTSDEDHPVNQFLDRHSGKLSPVLHLLALWSLRLLDKPKSKKERRRNRALQRTSVQNYISAIGEELINAAENSDLTDFKPVDFIQLYSYIATDIESRPVDDHEKKKNDLERTIGRLHQFHGFLAAKYGVPELHLRKILITAKGRYKPRNISVNFITEQDYQTILLQLGWGNLDLSRRKTMILVAFILAYRTGMRKEELHGLTFNDIQEGPNFEIHIFPNALRGLKTPAARRRLLLDILLTKEELDFVRNWIRRRETEARGQKNKKLPLFTASAISTKQVSNHDLFDETRQMIKLALNDQSAVWHHTRDSFIHTYNLKCLLRDDIPLKHPPHFVESDIFSTEKRKQFLQGLFPNDRAKRRLLYGAAVLIGHADIEEGFKSYFHLTDWLLGYYLRHPHHLPTLSSDAIEKLSSLKKDRVKFLSRTSPSPLLAIIEARHSQWDNKLRHPRMPGKGKPPKRKLPRTSAIKAMPKFDTALNQALEQDENFSMPSTEKGLKALEDFYTSIQALSLSKQRKYQAVAGYLQKKYIPHGRYLQITDYKEANWVFQQLRDIGIGIELSDVTYHPARYHSERRKETRYGKWKKHLNDQLRKGRKCHLPDKQDCIRINKHAISIKEAQVESMDILMSLMTVSYTHLTLPTN